MKTQKELENMTDFKLNEILKEVSNSKYKHYKYCSSPNNIMPLVIEHRLSIIKLMDGYLVTTQGTLDIQSTDRMGDGYFISGTILSEHENPYRAATIVLILLLKEGEELMKLLCSCGGEINPQDAAKCELCHTLKCVDCFTVDEDVEICDECLEEYLPDNLIEKIQ